MTDVTPSYDTTFVQNRGQARLFASQDRVAHATGIDKQELTFGDLVDLVNPLQHIPLINYAYRAITGDSAPKPAVQVAGGALFGGPLGAISSILTTVVEQSSGESLPQMAMNLFNGDGKASTDTAATALAANTATPAATDTAVASDAADNVPAIQVADIIWKGPRFTGADNATGATAMAANTSPVKPAAHASKPDIALAKANNTADMTVAANDVAAKPSTFVQSLQKGTTMSRTYNAAYMAPQRNPLLDQLTNVTPAATGTGDGAPKDDFSQKMLDALDRYQKMQQTAAPAGAMTDSNL